MDATMQALVGDLRAEQAALDRLVAGFSAEEWDRPSAAAGWTNRDTISHLLQFEEEGLVAVRDPDAFDAHRERALQLELATEGAYQQEGIDRGRAMPVNELLDRWRGARDELADELERLDARARLPWFGPSMSARSFATARLMETWAHGLDVFDSVAVEPKDTDRLAHVAALGCLTRSHSYHLRGLEPPEGDVRVELVLPGGGTFEFGDAAAHARVSGSAGEFCRVVVQRRHLDDTALVAEGPHAREWLLIAQAFAGRPGPGRPPTRADRP